jgi:hypothetical protein
MKTLMFASVLALPCLASGQLIVSQQPVSGGGVSRWSQLWQDPGPDGNDLDGDSVCWEDFTLGAPASINHIEWWGNGACEVGFQIEFWRQDPNTIAYQPLGVFYYGGDPTVLPEASFRTTGYTTSPGPGGLTHYALDLAVPVALPANDPVNPRWFIAIIGLTHQAYYTWDWAQGTGGSTRTFQFIRGGTAGGGNLFRQLGEGRAMVLGVPCAADWSHDGTLNSQDFYDFVSSFFAGGADFNGDGITNSQDFFDYVTAFFAGC